MAEQLYFEDVKKGMNIPQLIKKTSSRQLVEYAGASRDFHEIHYDHEIARKAGFPGVIIHGCLKTAFLCQMITDWIGEQSVIKKMSVKYLAIDSYGETLTCRGNVIDVYKNNGDHCVDCEVWTDNSDGQRTTIAKVTITLPSNGSA